MKKMTATALLTLIALQANAVEMRDASLGASSKVSEAIYDAGKSATDETVKVADFTGEQLEAFISKNLQSSYRASETIAKQIVKLSEVSKPAFRLTGKGLAMVFEVSGDATKAGLDVSKKIYIFLEPTLEQTGEFLMEIIELAFEGTSEASELITDINRFLSEVFEKPLDITTMTLEEIAKLVEKASEQSTKVSEFLLGAENLEKGIEYTGEGISLTSNGIGAAFYLVSQATTGISQLFDFNRKEREQIEQMVERGDVEGLAGLRDLIRHNINENIANGEDLNALLDDNAVDAYIKLKLTVPNLEENLKQVYGIK
ncbi:MULTISPECIES: hypothetical protein [Halobacteriovorax]|uniref:Lipoprotein n=1 Tax=Halobacteriovorax vibrionivorans TaxID=2152716 RepID=A0ABY0IHR4_9BACT|nr:MULTISPECIES: hypothetical protein [Halobacteriovorax]AYF43402.1 hypothetical protein BALOs_0388 [Halobacteriovorax sp. BALOs_7]RZF22025.1 hypothetical protein DAY19_10100 [Halobacteriovorax vibrionivorans]TGD47111.1 hypothetical protein EP118_09435 [Halobacteriovorax sp. Y22]